MSLENDIFTELYALRERLRSERTYSNGRTPLVCEDEALHEIARRIPTKAEDFQAIPGIGQRFVDLYSEDFLRITKKYAMSAAKGGSLDKRTEQTLRGLQKKLVDIGRGNRLLFQGKISKSTTFDLAEIPGLDILDFIFGKKRLLKLCDSSKSKTESSYYNALNAIFREVERDRRDKGQYDLYIAYPFIEGRIPGEDLDVRAPLALYPVTMERTPKTITLLKDPGRDAVYNNPLITAYAKSAGKKIPSLNPVIEDLDREIIMANLAEFYGSVEIKIDAELSEPIPFVNYKAKEFPKYNQGETKVVMNAVLGKYPTYSSSIQKDFDDLIAQGSINEVLSDLIEDLNFLDYLSEMPHPLTAQDIKDRGMEASERDITYINTLNSAQENIITAMNKTDELVVHGPPGTGKSQVITGLITTAVTSGKTVLMVSEKKTALDVVYSRLGVLSKYCMMIDDVGNKDQFYSQLGFLMDAGIPTSSTDLTSISDSIDREVRMLTNIADRIYSPGDFGIEPFKLYSMDKWLDPSDRRQVDEYRAIRDKVSSQIMSLKYPEVSELNRMFNDRALTGNFIDYCDCIKTTPWFTQMKQDLSDIRIGEMKADLMDLDDQIKQINSKGFMSKLFSKGKINRDATAILGKYFDSFNNNTVEEFIRDPSVKANELDDYGKYSSRATYYNRLESNQRIYGHNILALSDELNLSFEEANDLAYKYILNAHLQEFDASHKEILQEIEDFEGIVANIDRLIKKKIDLTRSKVEEILKDNLTYISGSKRRGEIIRIIESKRKWSLHKFIEKFGYELFKGVKVWLLTPEVVSEIIPLEMGLFDLVIFDEASQMYVEKGIPSIYRAKKVVVAGDHKQLRPSSLGQGRLDFTDDEDDDGVAALEEESLLDLARVRYDNILLNFHYRSRYEELIAFSNSAFYGGKLYVSPNAHSPSRPPIKMYRVDGKWENRSNLAEAEKILELLKEFFATRQNNETIGIITFNVSQRDLINDLIDEESAKDPAFAQAVLKEIKRTDNGEDVGLFIKNIESVQGDERDVIMFSIGYAKNEDGRLMQRFGWLNNAGGENRLNVAISRAKYKIHIVTSFEPEELQVEDAKNDGPRILKKYLQYARAISDGNTELAEEILSSFGSQESVRESIVKGESSVADRVRDALVRKGFNVDSNVGIGAYRIDLAIKQNDRYVIGIECDSRLYDSCIGTRERDYHRQKYLESRGWHIHRVWTPRLWKNPEDEIFRIIRSIEAGSP